MPRVSSVPRRPAMAGGAWRLRPGRSDREAAASGAAAGSGVPFPRLRHSVSDAALVEEPGRTRCVLAGLVAKVPDDDTRQVRAGVFPPVPHLAGQCVVGDHPPGR